MRAQLTSAAIIVFLCVDNWLCERAWLVAFDELYFYRMMRAVVVSAYAGTQLLAVSDDAKKSDNTIGQSTSTVLLICAMQYAVNALNTFSLQSSVSHTMSMCLRSFATLFALFLGSRPLKEHGMVTFVYTAALAVWLVCQTQLRTDEQRIGALASISAGCVGVLQGAVQRRALVEDASKQWTLLLFGHVVSVFDSVPKSTPLNQIALYDVTLYCFGSVCYLLGLLCTYDLLQRTSNARCTATMAVRKFVSLLVSSRQVDDVGVLELSAFGAVFGCNVAIAFNQVVASERPKALTNKVHQR